METDNKKIKHSIDCLYSTGVYRGWVDYLKNTIENLQEENKAWETNYNNLTAEHERVSAIAQAQAREIEEWQKYFELQA